MNTWLSSQSMARPNAIALYADGQTLTYRELHWATSDYAQRLTAWGVEDGAQLALLLPNSLDAVVAIHAAIEVGAILVLLNTRLTANEIDAQLTQTECQHLLYTEETKVVAEALGWAGKRGLVDKLDDLVAGRQGDKVTGVDDTPFATSDPVTPSPRPDLPLAIIFTSGTSGTPKGAVLSYAAFFNSAMASAYRIGTLPGDRWLCVLPLFHVGGLSIILRACLYGIAVDLWRQFDVIRIADALTTQPISLISLVPTMLHRLLECPGLGAPSSLRLVLLGGAAAPADLVLRALAAGWPISTTYGMTEAASQIATALPEQVRSKPTSVGKPLIFTNLRIVDEHGNNQPAGVYGEILISGPTLMIGYLQGVKDSEPLDSEPLDSRSPATGSRTSVRPPSPWFATGDIGYRDEDGDLFVVQRRSDLIISGGENIYPAEIEGVLRSHAAIADVAVFGIESAEWGQRVAAVIVSHDPQLNADQIEAFCRKHLAGYKVPRLVAFVTELPRLANGKLDRVALRTLVATS